MAKQQILTWARVSSPDGEEEWMDLEPSPSDIEGIPAIVKRSFRFTLNLGNCQSLRVEAGVEIPCEPNVEQINSADRWADNWVEGKVRDVVDRVREKSKSKKLKG